MVRALARSTVRKVLMWSQRQRYHANERSVWLIRPDHLGDLLFVRPGLKRFRAMLPDWRITLCVGPWSRPIAQTDPNIDEIVEIRFPGFERGAPKKAWQPYLQLFAESNRLHSHRPQAAVILREDHWWGGLLAHHANVPLIIGADRPEMHGLLTDSTNFTESHSVARNIELLEFAAKRLGGQADERAITTNTDPLVWNVTDRDRLEASNLLKSEGIDRPFVVIHPGTGAPVKLWPESRWAEVAVRLIEAGLNVLLTGSSSEADQLIRIAKRKETGPNGRMHNLAGKTSLSTLAAVFQQSELVVGVDSGPMHLAVAVGTPTVHIYGPSETATYGPWGDPQAHRVVRAGLHCRDCGNLSLSRPEGAGCILAVTPDDVVGAARELLSP